jgi:serine phosphatase RsbU (regulator of sigma subunit)
MYIRYFLILMLICNQATAQQKLIDSLEQRAREATSDTMRIFFLVNLSNVCDVIDIKKYAEPALKMAEELQQKNVSASVKQKARSYQALCYSNLGYLYDMQGSVGKALDYYQKSLKIFKDLKSDRNAAYNNSNIAYVYDHQGDVERASQYYNDALQTLLRVGDKGGAANTIHNMGNLYYKKKDYKKTYQLYAKGLELHEEINDKRGIAGDLNSLSTLLMETGESIRALAYCKRSMQLSKDIDDEFVVTSCYIASGNVYKGLKQYKLAKLFLDTALTLAVKHQFPELIKSIENHLSGVYAGLGDHKTSLEHYKQFVFFKDSLSNDATRRQSIKEQYKFDFELKEAALKIEQEKERIIAESKHRFQQTVIYGVIGVLLLVLVFSVFIFRSLQENRKQKKLVEEKSYIIEEKQKEIIDSINYAKRIQYTLLAHDEFLNEQIPDHFVYFAPKDIVSGDFYWASLQQNKFYIAVCDSTGHGVPGAFMSLLNIGFLSEAINEKNISQPDKILNYARERLINTISREGQKDGFDGILMCIDKKSRKISYAAANNAPILVTDGVMQELGCDRMPVGKGEKGNDFTLFETEIKKGDTIYLYTDGFADQFGGPRGKKFKYKPLNDFLLANSYMPLQEQKEQLQEKFANWKGNLEQVDDVCFVGIRL